jgi:hypothetical protein
VVHQKFTPPQMQSQVGVPSHSGGMSEQDGESGTTPKPPVVNVPLHGARQY